MADKVLQGLPNLEIYNSKFTPNYGEWALGFCGDVYDMENPGSSNPQDDPSLQRITSLDLTNRSIHKLINKVLTVSPFEFIFPFEDSKFLFYVTFLFCFHYL